MTRIVTYVHRYKHPPRKQKAVALEVPVVVVAKSSSPSCKTIARGTKLQVSHPAGQPALLERAGRRGAEGEGAAGEAQGGIAGGVTGPALIRHAGRHWRNVQT
jgi:hypothetical protein